MLEFGIHKKYLDEVIKLCKRTDTLNNRIIEYIEKDKKGRNDEK